MKTRHLLALAAWAVGSAASAGTLSGATTTMGTTQLTVATPAKITSAGQIIQVKHSFGVMYYGPDKNPNWTCYAKLEYSDGTAPEMIPVAFPAEGVARMRQYTKAGTYTATLTGTPYANKPGCLGIASTKFTIESTVPVAPTPPASGGGKPGTGNGAAMITPSGTAQGQLNQSTTLAASKPKVMKMTLVEPVITPSATELVVNLQSDRPSESCLFMVTVMNAVGGANEIGTAVFGPYSRSTVLPAGGWKLPIQGKLATGKYRVHVAASTNVSDPACVGYAAADFEVKRQAIHITNDITGIVVKDDGYDKGNKIWAVDLLGKSDEECGYYIRFKHLATGKTREVSTTAKMPSGYLVDFPEQPAYGEYEVSAGPWTPPPSGKQVNGCMGTQTAKVRLAAPAITGGFDFMKISDSAVKISTLLGDNVFSDKGTVSAQLPKSISLDVQFANATANGCAYTLFVSKGGVEKAVAYKSGQVPDVLGAIQQGPGWGAGEYVISAHASPLNGNLNLPSCLGKETHKLTVAAGGAIASGLGSLSSKFNCQDTWDSNTMFAAYDKVSCDVLITTKITGPACNYTMRIESPGQEARVYRKTHYVEGGDLVGFELYRGKQTNQDLAAVHAVPYSVRVWASEQDKAGGMGCAGESYFPEVHF